MYKSDLIGRCAVISSVVVLTACGGGGSGGGIGVDNSPASPLAYDSAGYASKAIEISANTNVDSINQMFGDLEEAFGLIADVQEALWSQSGPDSGTFNCNAGGNATVTFAGSGMNEDEAWSFNNCVLTTNTNGDVLLNGDYRYVDNFIGETETTASWKGYETYNISGELKATGEPIAIKGRADWDQVLAYDSSVDSEREIDTIGAFEYKMGNRYVAVTDNVLRYEGTDSDAAYSIAGKLIGSAIGGYIQVTTPTPLALSMASCPTEGVIRIASDGTAEVRYGSSAGGTASAVAVWIDGQVVESYADCSSAGFAPVY